MTTVYETLEQCVRGPCEGITKFLLTGRRFGNYEVKELCKVLLKYKNLRSLLLDSNKITDEGVKEICNVLPQCEALVWLDLRDNSIRYKGVQCILGVLPSLHKSMMRIILYGSLGKNEVKIINNTLQMCTSWKYMKEDFADRLERQSEYCEHCKQVRERFGKEKAAKKATENTEKKAKEEIDKEAKEDAERKAQEETEKKAKAKEEAEQKAKEEAAEKAKEKYINLGAITSLDGMPNLLKYEKLREAMDVIEDVGLNEGLVLRNEMTKIEEFIQQSQSKVESHQNEMNSEEFFLKHPGLVDRVEYEYKTLVLEVNVLQEQHRQKSVASQAVGWQCSNEERIPNVRIVVEKILAAPRQRQEQSEVLNTLRGQQSSRGAALEKCRECIEYIKEATDKDIDKECQFIICNLEEFTGVLDKSVTSLEGRIKDSEGILESLGSEVPNGVMEEFNEICRKVELIFEQLSMFSRESVDTRSASAAALQVGKERFTLLKDEFQENYAQVNAKMIKEAKVRDVNVEVSVLKLYKRSLQLCDGVINGNVFDGKWAPEIATHKVTPWRETFQALLSQCTKASELEESLSVLCKVEVIDLRITTTELQSYVAESVSFANGLDVKAIHPQLDVQEAAAVHAFTRSDPFSSSGRPLYTEVNSILQNTTTRTDMSKHFVSYIELMQRGMRRFPPYAGVAFRGEHGDYCTGTQKVLYRLTSFTTNIKVALRSEFTGDGGTVFVVPNFTGYDIRECSACTEMEVQTELMTVFHVADKFRVSAWDRKAVYAKHVDAYRGLLSKFNNSWVVVLFKE